MKSLRKILAFMAVLSVMVFMGCNNPADSSSGGTSLNDIEKQIAGGSIADGSDIYKFFANKKGEKSSGSSGNMRSARAAGSVGFSWSADSEGKVTITMDDSSTAPVFKFTVIKGSIGKVVTKTGSTTKLIFTPSNSSNLNKWEQKLVGTWYTDLDLKPETYKTDGNRMVFNNDKTGKVLTLNISGQWVTEAEFTWAATANILTMTEQGEQPVDIEYKWLGDGNKIKIMFTDDAGDYYPRDAERMQ